MLPYFSCYLVLIVVFSVLNFDSAVCATVEQLSWHILIYEYCFMRSFNSIELGLLEEVGRIPLTDQLLLYNEKAEFLWLIEIM